MSEKILFVDDEPSVLDGYQRNLYREFQVETATSGREALSLISAGGSYAVVVSDMRMPGMDGVALQSQVSCIAPDTVRVILTGYADFQSAMDAVNEGKIFRFLTKPCESGNLKSALRACLGQYRLVIAEKELLEKTLLGCIEALVDILSLSNPAAFSRTMRIRKYVKDLSEKMGIASPWKFEIAALLSQLGCVTLSAEIIEMARRGESLSVERQEAFDRHPVVAGEILKKIPRLEDVAWIVSRQRKAFDPAASEVRRELEVGAEILRVAIDFDDMKARGIGDMEARARLAQSSKLGILAVQCLKSQRETQDGAYQSIRIPELAVGMVLQEDVRTNTGVLVVPSGQELTYALIVCLNNFFNQRAIPDRVSVLNSKA